MAIAFDAATNGGNALAGSLTFSHTCTGSNRFLVVAVNDANAAVSGVTYAGTAMTRTWTETGLGESFWYLLNPASGANNVVVTKSGGTASVGAVAASYTGASTSAIDSKGSNTTDNTTSPQTKSTTVVGSTCWTVGYSAYGNGASVNTLTCDKTSRITQDWTGSGNNWGLMICDSNAIVGTGSQGIQYTKAGTVGHYQSNTLSIVEGSSTSIKTINGLAIASVKTKNGLAIASVKTINGLA